MEGFKKCSIGHFYNEETDQCPYCPTSSENKDEDFTYTRKIDMGTVMSEDLDNEKGDETLKTKVFGRPSIAKHSYQNLYKFLIIISVILQIVLFIRYNNDFGEKQDEALSNYSTYYWFMSYSPNEYVNDLYASLNDDYWRKGTENDVNYWSVINYISISLFVFSIYKHNKET
tara:strand:- start:1096 stop:1611 length:516 start_codon:yes stop_codon:yes gene_type:complete